MLENAVNDAGPVEAADDRRSARDCRWLEPANLLHPPHVELDMRSLRRQWIQLMFGASDEEGPKVGLHVHPGLALVPGEVCRDRQPQRVNGRRRVAGGHGQKLREYSHPPSVTRPATTDREAATGRYSTRMAERTLLPCLLECGRRNRGYKVAQSDARLSGRAALSSEDLVHENRRPIVVAVAQDRRVAHSDGAHSRRTVV